MAKVQGEIKKLKKNKMSRPGVHSKKNSSKLKSSKNYTKKYNAQGKQYMEKNSLWKNIREKAKQNKMTGAKPKKPTSAMLKQEVKIKAKKK